MKKLMVLLLALVCVIGCVGCICSHQWVQASCLEPKNCPLCGKVEGEALGHIWLEATCMAAETCAACGMTQGEKVDHQWQEATCAGPSACKWCGQTRGEALAHAWQKATTEAPATCSACGMTDGERITTDVRFTTAANSHLFGGWEMEFPMSGETLNLADYVEEVAFIATVSFMEDGNLDVAVRFKDQAGFMADLVAKTQEMIYLQFEGMEIAREDADVMFQDVYGMSVAEYAADVWAEADWDAMLEMYGIHRVYYVQGGVLNIGKSWEAGFEGYTCAISGDRLTITAPSGEVTVLTRTK